MSALRERALAGFRERFGRAPELLVRAPGRVSILGGHVDYNQGLVMPAAIDRCIVLAAARREDALLRVYSAAMDEEREVSLSPIPGPRDRRESAPGWLDYPLGVAWILECDGARTPGLDVYVASDLPSRVGVSSSAALEVAFLLVWDEVSGVRAPRLELAHRARRVENHYVGVGSGVQDQFASLFGAPDHVLFLDCRSEEWRRLPLPAGHVVLVADSRVRRRLSDGWLDDRRGECEEAVSRLRTAGFELEALRDLKDEDLASVDRLLAPPLARRARHVVEECRRVSAGVAALEAGRTEELGALMRRAHRSSRDLYEVSLDELDHLAETAWECAGCLGARLSGAGFGGCVVALVEEASVEATKTRLEESYDARFGRRATVFAAALGAGASVERLAR